MRISIAAMLSVSALLCLFALGCSAGGAVEVTEIRHYPMDSTEGLIAKSGVGLDREVSADQKGSLRVTATKATTVRLYETGDVDVENARLIYQAKLRTEGVKGKVYLEMWCHFPGKGEFFSRALHAPLSGSNDWTSQETPFFLQRGQNPDNVKLNLVIDGEGTVWIDDVRLVKGSLA